MSNMLRKISPKSVLGSKPKAPEAAIDLYTVIGIATGTKTGETDYGPWTVLTGRFESTHAETGEIFVAPKCFLPEPLQSLIAESLNEKDKDGNTVNNSIQFGVMVGIKPADTATGYEYTVRELVDKSEADPLAALRNEVKAALPAPAPEKSKGKK